MNKQWCIGVATTCALAFGAAWAMEWFADGQYNDDPEVAKLEKLRDEVLEKDEKERRAVGGQLRDAMKNMTEQQRASFMESSMPIFVRMGATYMEKRFDEFLAMSPEEQQSEMDKKIDEQLARQQQRNAGGGDRSRGGPPKFPAKKMDEFRKKMMDWTTPGQRAKFQTVIGMYNARREERGLSPVEMGGWR